MLGAESPVRPNRSVGGEQQPPSPRSSPESQNLKERERGGGDSPRDRQGVGALLAAMGAEYTSAEEEYPTTRTRGSLQPPPPPASSQKFRQHSIEVNTLFNPYSKSNQQPPITNTISEKQSTPGPLPSRKRKVSDMTGFSASTPTPAATKQKRAPRPQYTKEQEDFIWFCRDDLSMSWRKVVELYNDYWHPFESEPHIRSESGLQSRYYRILDFPVKIRKKKEPSRPDLGLIPSTNRRYPWMGVLTDRRDRESCVGSGGMALGGIGTGGGGRSLNINRRALSSGGSGKTITVIGGDGRIEPDEEDMVDEEDEDHDEDDNLNETSTISTASPNGSNSEYPSRHSHRRHHHHHLPHLHHRSHTRHPHHLHHNTPTRSSQQTNHLRPSNLLTNIDQPTPDGYESSWTTSSSSSSSNSNPHQHQQPRCTYPRPAPLGALLEHIRAPKSSSRVRIPRRIRIRQRERLAGECEGECEAERERERRPEGRRVDPRLSVTSLCV
ncbi:hypothetical protein L873DRAFT_1793860 [Choiromyces venosus 120613-1]|uniref:Uncharacterized protein n=1 Tax=Choiromyces venosus 120613-1 TaxID=1336337 RepID=A0A3N4JGY5_9PEZI|nr:hypothetical protein L873DRAFT_1793860 [Choiromyces venosus 120613-1]